MNQTWKTVTDYDFEHMEELQRVAGKTFARRQIRARRLAFFVGGAGFMASGLSLALRRDSVVLCLICCAIGGVMLAWSLFFYFVTAWTTGRAMGSRWKDNEYRMLDQEILAVQGKESSRYPYDDCYGLMETEKNFYVIMNTGHGLMLDKANLRGGTPEELRAFLVERTGKTTQWMGKKRKDKTGK